MVPDLNLRGFPKKSVWNLKVHPLNFQKKVQDKKYGHPNIPKLFNGDNIPTLVF